MSWWPFRKKEPTPIPVSDNESLKPSDLWIQVCAKGDLECVYLPYQYVNWAYEYLNEDIRVKFGDRAFNKHIVMLTGACVKWIEDNK